MKYYMKPFIWLILLFPFMGITQDPDSLSIDSLNIVNNNIYKTGVKGNCMMCAQRIEEGALTVPGVKTAKYSLTKKVLTVTIEEDFNSQMLHFTISGLGHDTDEMSAVDEVYNSLPGCCSYRDVQDSDFSEDAVRGVIYGLEGDEELPLISAFVSWNGTSRATVTDELGYFALERQDGDNELLIQYVGYNDEIIDMTNQSMVKVVLSSNMVLEEIGITAKKRSASVSYLETLQTLNITEDELLRAACCNLAESFVTTSSIDNTVTDAVTGTKKIEMLGLSGSYIMMSRENMPDIRGLASITGLDYTPGPWISSIQINPGTASVVNGYEGLTGQINVEYKKPQGNDRLMVELYGNQASRYELNLIAAQEISKNWSTSLLFHGGFHQGKNDNNDDSFADMPVGSKYIVMNRWKWFAKNGWEGQFGAKYIRTRHEAGQLFMDDGGWQSTQNADRIEVFNKGGVVFPNRKTASLGIQLNYVNYSRLDSFELRSYEGKQQSFYANVIFQDQLKSKNNKYKFGFSFQGDEYEEDVMGNTQYSELFTEATPGVFTEYTFNYEDKWNLVAGLRGDYHNLYGFFMTPRLHLRYAPNDNTVLRLAGGRGLKTANIFAEQIGYFASNRAFIIEGDKDSDLPYGLDAEVAWNVGGHISKSFNVGRREHVFNLSIFRTHFENQVVIDVDEDAHAVHFYNLDGKSFSNSVQFQYETEIVDRLDVRLAYRYNQVETTFKSIGLAQRPLISPHRAFINLAYKTPSQWQFDLTYNWISSARLPDMTGNSAAEGWGTDSDSYFLAYFHISKKWKNFNFYVGGENILDYQQNNAIISADNPFSDDFDPSLVWGPIFGRNIYAGIRYTIRKVKN